MTKKILLSLIFMTMLNYSLASGCETVDCALNQLIPHLASIEDVIGTIAYISGVVFVYKSIIKFKEHNESKGQVKLSIAILYFVAGGLLLSLPTVISKGRETISVSGTNDKLNY